MNDTSRRAIDAETTPVNPYSLLEAVNRSSRSANTAWLIYLLLMGYLLITVAGVSHKHLLLGSDISLPILQVGIELTLFFLVAPILLLLVHMGLFARLALLARKALELAASIRMLESSDARSHPLRLELDNFFFVQAIAGPERSPAVGLLLHGMSWLTLVAMPVLLLAYVQLVFLPYHDATITWVHRLVLLADIALLVLVGVFLWRLETSFFRAFWGMGRQHPVSLACTAMLLAAIAAFSLGIATIPGEPMDTALRQANAKGRAQLLGYTVPDLGIFATADSPLLGFFQRNLDVTDANLAIDRDVTPGKRSLSLRGRDLRYARLDRSDLHQADMTGANLEGASLVGADLRGALLSCADLNQLLLTDNRAAAGCVRARDANFSKARLTGAGMVGIDLRGAKLEETQAAGAQLAQALMTGANLSNAGLQRADLTGAWLQGANLLLASLQGADLTGAKAQVADFTGAGLQGANLSLAGLEGAVLRDAELEGANLRMAVLYGADVFGVRLAGSDLTGAQVWRTRPPGAEGLAFTDMAQIIMRPPTDEELAVLGASLAPMSGGPLKPRLADAMAGLTDAGLNASWAGSSERDLWQGFAKSAGEAAAADGYKARFTEVLGRLACRPRFADGAVAAGIVHRALVPGFKGDIPVLYDKLRSPDCPASAAVSTRLMQELATAANAARGQ
jgi:uncharacterized protein YjbI with pentapeptide repeats